MAKGTIRIAPPPCTYAIIRMDPEAMIKDLGLDDPETLSEVEKMNPQKYLVYVEWVRSYQLPCFRFQVCVVRTSMDPCDCDRGEVKNRPRLQPCSRSRILNVFQTSELYYTCPCGTPRDTSLHPIPTEMHSLFLFCFPVDFVHCRGVARLRLSHPLALLHCLHLALRSVLI